MLFRFPAAVTAVDVFRVTHRAEVPMHFFSSNWNAATIKLTVDYGWGGSQSLYPFTDAADMLTGVEFAIGANWSNPIVLAAGNYGITVTGTPTGAIYLAMTHKYLIGGDFTNTYSAQA